MEYQLPKNNSQLIFATGQLENRYILSFLKKLGLTVDTASIITYVNNHPGTSQKEIAAYLHKQPATVTNMIKRLKKRLLLIRRNDQRDSREKQVYLLKGGLDLVAEINKPVQNLEKLYRPCVDKKGHVDLIKMFQSLTQALIKLEK